MAFFVYEKRRKTFSLQNTNSKLTFFVYLFFLDDFFRLLGNVRAKCINDSGNAVIKLS